MWELSPNHCCATCQFSQKGHGISAANDNRLFPMSQMLACAYHKDGLGENAVQFVLVRCDGRCDGYECDERRYLAEYGESSYGESSWAEEVGLV